MKIWLPLAVQTATLAITLAVGVYIAAFIVLALMVPTAYNIGQIQRIRKEVDWLTHFRDAA